MIISFDGPPHGKLEGKTTMMPDFLEAITEINQQFGPFEAAIGHSSVGMCLCYSSATDLNIKKLVKIGATDKISDAILNFTKNLKIKPNVAKRVKKDFDKQWNTNINDNSSSTVAHKITIPTLVVHDSNDVDVPVSCALNIRQNVKEEENFNH